MEDHTRAALKKNLPVALVTYLVISLLLMRFFVAEDCTRFFEIVSLPAVWVTLLIFLVLDAILVLILELKKPQCIGVIIASVGIIAIVLYYVMSAETIAHLKYDIVSFGIGAIGVGVAFYSTGIAIESHKISKESDKRMAAMANLEFHEKIAVVEAYISDILHSDINKKTSTEVEERRKRILKANAERIDHDIRGAKQLEEYVDPKVKRQLDEEINNLKNIASENSEQYQELIEKLTELQKEDTT